MRRRRTWTGVGERFFLGPAAVNVSYPQPTCVGGDDASIGYPFKGWTSDPDLTGDYRINVCTRQKVWKRKTG